MEQDNENTYHRVRNCNDHRYDTCRSAGNEHRQFVSNTDLPRTRTSAGFAGQARFEELTRTGCRWLSASASCALMLAIQVPRRVNWAEPPGAYV